MIHRLTNLSLVLLTTVFTLTLSGQTIYPLYTGEVPCAVTGPATEEFKEDIGVLLTYVDVPEVYHYAPIPKMATGGAVLIVPGGGYYVEAWDLEGVDIANRLTAAGLHAFVLRHRLPGKIEGPCKTHVALDDAQRGMQVVRSLADSLGFDPERVAIMGFSAGGHLAGSASVHGLAGDPTAEDPVLHHGSRPDRSILVYPVLIMDAEATGHAGSQGGLLGTEPDLELLDHYNLPARVDTLTPPALLVHASDDTGVPVRNSLRYYEALVRAGVAADLRVYAHGGHGFGSAVDLSSPTRNWLTEAIDWLRGGGW